MDSKETRPPEARAVDERELPPYDEKSFLEGSGSRWPLLGGAVFVTVGLVMLVVLAVTLDSHRRNLFLGWTAVFLVFVFGFAACIVWSFNRDKKKLRDQSGSQ
jgi:cbb3-type cytochrome oxidase subunit 3